MGGRAWLAYVLALAATASAASLVAQESADPELSAATSLLDGRRFDDARKAFERLSDTRGSACSECLLGLAEADLRLGKGKDAIKLCDRTLRAGIADAKLRARAHNIKALALVQEGHNSEKALKAAEEELTRALEAAPDGADIRFNRGRLLLRQGRDAEGTADLRRYLELSPTGPTAERAPADPGSAPHTRAFRARLQSGDAAG
jgi:tetratricopeptide (TPR) repeat protein